MRSENRDLSAAVGVTVACAFGVLFLPVGPLRFLCAALLCLAAPGYALTAALFPPHSIRAPVRLMVIALIGLATLALGSLVLNVSPAGLTKASWTALLVELALGGSLLAAWRRRTTPMRRLKLPVGRPSGMEAALLLVAALVVAASIAVSGTPLPAKNVVGYTQLWMLPAGTLQQAPCGALNALKNSCSVPELSVGVRSAETTSRVYRLELKVGDVSRVIRSRLVLRPGGQFVQKMPVAGYRGPSNDRRAAARRDRGTVVTALLYRLDRPGVIYRRVTALLRSR